MRIPIIRGVIDRRILVNYRVDPVVLAPLLPAPFRPRLIHGAGMAGICLIRLRGIRPLFLPSWLGISSENAAHRTAVDANARDFALLDDIDAERVGSAGIAPRHRVVADGPAARLQESAEDREARVRRAVEIGNPARDLLARKPFRIDAVEPLPESTEGNTSGPHAVKSSPPSKLRGHIHHP